MRIAVGCDHIVTDTKNEVVKYLKDMKFLMKGLTILKERIIQYMQEK